MAQYRPRRRSKPMPTGEVVRDDSQTFSVAASAVRTMSMWPSHRVMAPSDPDVREMLNRLPHDDIRRAARQAGRPEPAKRTVRDWKKNGRIPDARTAELISRRELIARIGGVARAQALLGRSRSALNDWMAGRTNAMRSDAQVRLRDARAAARLTAAGIDPTTQIPRITFKADVMVRLGAADYDYRHRKEFRIGPPDGQDYMKGNQMSRQDIISFAMAMARDDFGLMVVILEDYVSTNIADFGTYDDATGFHFENINSVRVQW
ncbi:hypothetical protein [Gordonia sihwensis]|uniref:hypothetical protein n=1 Tax=Gordonia sihwensis TaxID=173559 RepID=UPI003D96991B